MSRPAIEGVVFVDDMESVAIVDLVAGQDAVFAVDLEQRDRDHEGAGELEGVVLGKGKIVRHFEGSIRSGPIPARWLLEGPPSVAITAKAQPQRRQLASRPLAG